MELESIKDAGHCSTFLRCKACFTETIAIVATNRLLPDNGRNNRFELGKKEISYSFFLCLQSRSWRHNACLFMATQDVERFVAAGEGFAVHGTRAHPIKVRPIKENLKPPTENVKRPP